MRSREHAPYSGTNRRSVRSRDILSLPRQAAMSERGEEEQVKELAPGFEETIGVKTRSGGCK